MQDGALLGMTPMTITLQEGQGSRRITLAMDGYESQDLQATRDTPSPLRVTLKKKSAAPPAAKRPARSKAKRNKGASKPKPKPKPKPKKRVVPVW